MIISILVSILFINIFMFVLICYGGGFFTDKQLFHIMSYLLVLLQNILINPNHVVIFYLQIIGIILMIICYEPITLICKKIILMF
jgi:hypothetical protein